jgi:hypothetical protein
MNLQDNSYVSETIQKVTPFITPLGLIVHGEDHFLIRGPKPDAAMAKYLVRRWIFPSIEDLLGTSPPIPADWQITTSEFRENIEWTIVLSCAQSPSPAVAQLVAEVAARGVAVEYFSGSEGVE